MKLSKLTRFIVAVVAGVAAALLTGFLLEWQLAPLAGWDVFAVVLVGLILADFANDTAADTAKMARKDAINYSLLDGIVLLTSLASIGAEVVLISGKNAGTSHIIFGLISILLSWIVVHVLFSLRYAMLYYNDEEGGIDFNSKERPRFSDFAYLAFTIGMTYQVSDTAITDHKIRRAALMHAIISFVFGVMIIASTINFVVSLAG